MAAAQKTRRAPTLRTNILLLLLCGFFAVAIPAYWGFTTIVNSTVSQLGRLFGEKQILFDRSRGMGVLMQEVALAENLTRSPIIAGWPLPTTATASSTTPRGAITTTMPRTRTRAIPTASPCGAAIRAMTG